MRSEVLTVVKYGNEPPGSINLSYSRAVMFIRIPPFRMRGSEDTGLFWANVRDDWAEKNDYDYSDEFSDDFELYVEDEDEESGDADCDQEMSDNGKE